MLLKEILILEDENKENIILDSNLAKKFENLPVIFGAGDLVVGYLYNPKYINSRGIYADIWLLSAFYRSIKINFSNIFIPA